MINQSSSLSIDRSSYKASETNADGSMDLEQFEAMLCNLVFFNNEARTFEGAFHPSTHTRTHTHARARTHTHTHTHTQVAQRCLERGIVTIERVSARHMHRLAVTTAAEVLGCWDAEIATRALGRVGSLWPVLLGTHILKSGPWRRVREEMY